MFEKSLLSVDPNNGKTKKQKKNKKQKKGEDEQADNSGKDDRKPAAKPKCNHCGKIGHRDENCWSLEKNAKKCPVNYQTANSILKKKPKTNATANTAALFTED
jgi:hypothetical protein